MPQQRATEILRQTGVTPLVRASRSQLEVKYLPPYGDPEVNIPGEVATYLALTGATLLALERLDEGD